VAGDPAPLAAVQAAVLKTAAGKQAAAKDPGIAAQNNAVAQDLAVMADQAKGYTAGVNQGTIVAQDQRSAQSQRLALEASQAAAERARALELERMQTSRMQLEQQAAAQKYERDATDNRRIAAERAKEEAAPEEADIDNASSVVRHASLNMGPRFQEALGLVLQNTTNPSEAVQFLANSAKHNEPWAAGIKPDVIRRYAEQYFRALEGRAVNVKSLIPQSATAPKRNVLKDWYGIDA
jgi:hypothetical protein